MSAIPDKLVDVDFLDEPQYVRGDLGVPCFADFGPSFEDMYGVMSDADIDAAIDEIAAYDAGLDKLVTRILNQKNEGCHDDKTEVLTENGWVGWPDYNWSDRLATVHPGSGQMEFQSPTERHIYEYDGPLYCSAHDRIDFAVTPSHRMYVRRWDERRRKLQSNYQFLAADSLGWYVGLLAAPTGFVGTELIRVAVDGDREYDGDDFVSLLGALVSDGWAGDSTTTRSRVSFCCFNKQRQRMLRELAVRVGFREQPSRPGVWYRQDAPALAHWLRANMYAGGESNATTKRCPAIVKAASQRQIALFLKFFGDQSHTRACGAQYYTSSVGLADDLQEVALRIGRRASINKREQRVASIGGRVVADRGSFVVTQWGCDELSLSRKKQLETIDYRGPVFCATVPNGTLITRRNKSVLISGNSCVANAYTQANQILQAKQRGRENVVQLSPISLYKRIGRSPNSGATVSDGVAEMDRRGILPLDTPENRAKYGEHVMPATGFYEKFPAGWEDTAKKFAGLEHHVVRSVEGLLSALCQGHPVVVGRQGHSICYCRPMRKGGNRVVKYANSWGDWGDGGYGYDSQKLISQSANWAAAVRSVVVPTT